MSFSDFICIFLENYCFNIKKIYIHENMVLEIRSTPVLTGEDAERFVREAEENKRNPQRKKLLFSFEDIDSMMERSRKYLKEHGGKGPFAK